MRRKSSRTTRNPSPEKTKSEPPRRSRRQSARRSKRASSGSSEDSDDAPAGINNSIPVTENSESDIKVKSVEESSETVINSNKEQDEASVEYTASLQNSEGQISVCADEQNVELSKGDRDSEGEGIEDMEEKKNKGKSKDNKTNFEPSSTIVEPETENENVQGTPQSPSNDNADTENVIQNVNDTTKSDTEAQGNVGNEETIVTPTESLPGKQPEEDFVSEYTQVTESAAELIQPNSQNKNSGNEERSTTPELRSSNRSTAPVEASETSGGDKELKSVKENDDNGSYNSSPPKKKITLRRSPPEYKEVAKDAPADSPPVTVRRTSLSDDNKKIEEKKPSKKITLKRHTTEESNTSEVCLDNKRVSRSMSSEAAEKRKSFCAVDEEKGRSEKGSSSLDVTKPPSKRIKLIRSLSRDTADEEERAKRIASRRNKWGRSDWLNKLTSSFYNIDVDSIKIVCPTLEFLNENEINLESIPRERLKSETEHKRKVSIDNKSDDSDRPEYEKQTSEDSSGEVKTETNPNIIAMNRKISIVDDTASKLRPPPSPAKNPTSSVLFITNLVRPFTVKQLKELLERTGKIKEDGFWTDRIKSKCYVQYESEEEAEATRDALHGVHWPIGNGKKLVIDYATVEDLEKAKNPAPPPVVHHETLPEKENREPDRDDVVLKERDREERKKRDLPVREWDVGKEESRKRFSKSRSRSRERARKHSRRSYTPEGYFNSKKHRKADDAVPQKLMDDLFLKTKATPSIYWQPLSPEEIATKQQQRLVRMEEHKRRIEETRGRLRDNRRGPFRRR
ncbi:hypothetical protein NQ315_015762 [Exocentrus adspersus]|uniref:RRM domain-containing protein n=1 Tax=Exocentrus adspersus TaxID=1586481 RepID=A0AAV8W393_9CUCU|nr:hypothetical protein NQ315_015762 [Exocentrus adspersus]